MPIDKYIKVEIPYSILTSGHLDYWTVIGQARFKISTYWVLIGAFWRGEVNSKVYVALHEMVEKLYMYYVYIYIYIHNTEYKT